MNKFDKVVLAVWICIVLYVILIQKTVSPMDYIFLAIMFFVNSFKHVKLKNKL